ncbi:N-acetylglucosamine-6-phosphate deacetylase [Halalkalibacter krulwichiae]|uniref:N-acetylglucosamine-6-phosphate deacetylase n=1 Tax=Halalkalibacter krulwichiae TaxID=199441 RepID=A0A1X9MHC8_9BACI|nr:N-acetylglucosamine-6-phosphate deacetylase [Halalkalibacter krulwichiae]ARK29842.1 N-acetylglucosamine-6-phosphate deacetylase [Halalkalibacter krulwichiae]
MNRPNTIIIKNITIYAEKEIMKDSFIQIKNDKISKVGPMNECPSIESAEILTFSSDFCLLPGFIDLHIHGVNGADTMDHSFEALSKMAQALPKEGTTSFLATTITQSNEQIEAALSNVSAYQVALPSEEEAEIVGIHLEGPFISPERAGAQPLSHIKDPDLALFDQWQELSGNQIKLVTMAPEREHGLAFVKHLTNTGVIASIGHSDATYALVKDAVALGLRHVTHLYNGMRGFHHREPGVAGAALDQNEVMVEMIVDGIHIHPAVVNTTYKAKGANEIILITDAMRAKGLADGTYDLGGQQVEVSNQKALLPDGTLAGSMLTMDQAIKNMKNYTGCSLEDITIMASKNPAIQIGVFDRKGSIAVGKDADLTIVDQDLNVVLTVCRGKISYQKK